MAGDREPAFPPYIYGREAGRNEKVWTEMTVRDLVAERDGVNQSRSHLVRLLDAANAERDALQAKVEAMEKDAGRYAWLRERVDVVRDRHGVHEFAMPIDLPCMVSTAASVALHLDAAIDAARAALAQPTGEKP